jgi:hypothetical protein
MADDALTNIAASQGEDPDSQELWKAARYIEEIELYERETQKWTRQAKSILKRYKDDRGGDGDVESKERRFNSLWSNTQNLLPALYSRNPKPDIQRRFKDADPIGRVASDVMERCASYFCDTDRFSAVSRACVLDYLLPGRGTNWIRYVPHFESDGGPLTNSTDRGDDEDEQLAPEVLAYEEVVADYIHREDYGHNICRTWDEVWLVWRKVYMTKRELKDRFLKPLVKQYGAQKARDMLANWPMDYVQKDTSGKTIDNGIQKSVVYECWDKNRKIAVWLNMGRPDIADLRPDPLRLDNFFPSPRPLFANLANDSLIPVPLYKEYQDQASQLDELTNRIAQMTRCLKIVGVHDASAEGIQRMFNEGTENETIPVANWSVLAGEKGGLKGVIDLLDIQMIAQAILAAYETRDQVKKDLDEITGISDVVRGVSDPNETAEAQGIKSAYHGNRISDHQQEVQRFIRETVRLTVDVICNHFSDGTIKMISGVRLLSAQEKQAYVQAKQMAAMGAGAVQPPPLPPNTTPEQFEDMMQAPTWEDVLGLMRNNAMRCFRIDIETDSIIRPDEQQEKADRVEFVKGMSELMNQATQAGAQDPDIVPLVGQIIQFAVRAFPVGKELESSIASYIQKKEKEAANPQPKPNPEVMKVQADAQANQQKIQADAQANSQKMQQEFQLDQQKAALDAQVEQTKQTLQAQQDAQENELEAKRRIIELQTEDQASAREAQRKADLQRDEWIHKQALAEMESTTQYNIAKMKAEIAKEQAIEVARINASATSGEQEEAQAIAQAEEVEKPVSHDKTDEILAHLKGAAQAINNLAQAHAQNTRSIQNLHKAVTSEKEIVRDPKTGKPTGVRIKQNPAELAKGLKND